MDKEFIEHGFSLNRRRFLSSMGVGIGSVALGSLLMPDLFGLGADKNGLPPGIPHFAPKAKRVIYLFQNGAPSQQELFDYKPMLREMNGKEMLHAYFLNFTAHQFNKMLTSTNPNYL